MARLYLALVVLLALSWGAAGQTLFASADGNANATCTVDQPCSLATACEQVGVGGFIEMFAGVYDMANPCIINVASVSITGEAGAEMNCASSCFVFVFSPFTLTGLSMSSSTADDSDALVVATNDAIGDTVDFVIQNVDVFVQSCNFLDLNVPASTGLENITVSLNEINMSGTCREGTTGNGCIFVSFTTLYGSVFFTNSSFSQITTTSNAPFFDSSTNFYDQLVMEGLSFSDMTVSSLSTQGFSSGSFKDIEVTDVTNYEGSTGDPLFYLTGTIALVQNVAFTRVQDMHGLLQAAVIDLVAEGISVESCNGTHPDNGTVFALTFNYFVSPLIVTQTVFGLSITDSTYGGFVYTNFDNSNGTVVLYDVALSNLTATNGNLIVSGGGNFVMTDFNLDQVTSAGGLMSVSNPALVTVTNGNITEAAMGDAMATFYNDGGPAKMLFRKINTDNLNVSRFFVLQTGESAWQMNITDFTFDTDSDVAVDAIVECFATAGDVISTNVTVDSSPCDLGNTCDLEVADGYVDGGVCDIVVDDSSVCPSCGNENNDDDDDGSSGPEGWVIALIVLAVVVVIIAVVAIIAAAVVVMKKKQDRAAYDTI